MSSNGKGKGNTVKTTHKRILGVAALALFSFGALAAGCGKSATAPSAAPTKMAGMGADTTKGTKDDSGSTICMGVADGVGVCNDPAATDDPFAWFCLGGELYLLDCSAIVTDAFCVDDGTGAWGCLAVSGGDTTGDSSTTGG